MGIKDAEILVVGAGPTGLALAFEMARMGMPVRIIDKSSGPVRWSQALVVQARTLEQFERYGIAAEMVEHGRPIHHASMYHLRHRFAHLDFAHIASRYPFVLFLPQNETEAILLRHLSRLGIEVERDTELVGFVDGSDGGTATVRHANGGEESIPYRWLAGCDGAHSKVRHAMGVPFEGDAVGLRFFLGDLKLSGVDIPSDDLVIHLQGGDVLFLARLQDDITRVIVAQHESQDDSGDRMPEIADFQRWIDAYGLHIHVEDAVWRAPFHIHQRKATHYRQGNVFLAGDASHIHSPVAGQGMNTGLQDAANLAWKLAAVAAGAPATLLDSYNEERGAVGEILLARTSSGLEAATTTSAVSALLRDLAGSAVSLLPWVQTSILGFVSETAIHYRGSSIVEDYGGSGSLHAGDRVPNPEVALADGTRQPLLAPLLARLTEARHLLIAQGIADTAVLRAAAPRAIVLALAPRQTAEAADLFGNHPGMWLVRPDGYLGFRGKDHSLSALADYARRVGVAAE